MDKKIGEELVNEIVEIINQHRIVEKPNPKKQKKKPARAFGILTAALIIPLTITIQTDSFRKNQTAYTNELLNIKKTTNLSASEKNYTTDLNFPEYLEEVNSMDASPESELLTDL